MRRLLLAATAALLLPAAANAQAIITNGTVTMGVDTAGQLNIGGGPASFNGNNTVGLRDNGNGGARAAYEATADGCLCEGWGAAVQGTGTTVFANNSTGSSFVAGSFASTATTATSVVSSVGGALTVSHAFSPSVTPFLYQVDVTITNTSGVDFAGSTLYRRTMDWDIEPTPFNEYSTIKGAAGATNVLAANDNGFCSSNALVACGGAMADFTDLGPFDHGANFDFIFSALKAGQSQTLTIFYGAAPTERTALAALAAVGAEVYSFGQAADDKLGTTPDRTTFIFAFKGVGGTVIGGVPEPTSWALMIVGFGFAGAALRRRRFQAAA